MHFINVLMPLFSDFSGKTIVYLKWENIVYLCIIYSFAKNLRFLSLIHVLFSIVFKKFQLAIFYSAQELTAHT